MFLSNFKLNICQNNAVTSNFSSRQKKLNLNFSTVELHSDTRIEKRIIHREIKKERQARIHIFNKIKFKTQVKAH